MRPLSAGNADVSSASGSMRVIPDNHNNHFRASRSVRTGRPHYQQSS